MLKDFARALLGLELDDARDFALTGVLVLIMAVLLWIACVG